MRRLVWVCVLMWPALASGQELGPVFTSDLTVMDYTLTHPPSVAMAPDGSFVVAERGYANFGTRHLATYAQRLDRAGQPLGGVFQVSSSPISLSQLGDTDIAMDAAGAFTIVWPAGAPASSQRQDIFGQRYDPSGAPRGGEFRVNSSTADHHLEPALAMTASGEALAVWVSPDGKGSGIYGQLLDAAGSAVGSEFQINSFTTDMQLAPAVAAAADGSFMVVWHSRGQDGSEEGVFGQRLDGSGAPLGAEFRVNTYTPGIQGFPAVAALGGGGFVVAWVSSETADDSGPGPMARRFDASGLPLGSEFRVGTQPIRLARRSITVVPDGSGFAVGWSSGDLRGLVRRYEASGEALGPALALAANENPQGKVRRHITLASNGPNHLVMVTWDSWPEYGKTEGVLLGALWPAGLAVDTHAGGGSNLNGILEPGEAVVVAPSWRNLGTAGVVVSGSITRFAGPGAPLDPAYVIVDGAASYGAVSPGATATCSSDCYVLGMTVPSVRPQPHMDAGFRETLTVGSGEDESRCWQIHVGGTFDDVSRAGPYYRAVETLVHFGVSGGCRDRSFCPEDTTTREQMAVFLLAAKLARRPGLTFYNQESAPYEPPRPAVGVFADVPTASPYAAWIEDLWNREVVEGCAPDHYCPGDPVTRAQMAVMLLRTLEGSAYLPPACTTPVFGDVPCSDPYARWINELAVRGLTAGCGGGNYCPGESVTRAQMAAFLTKTFALDLDAQSELQDRFSPCQVF